MIVRAALVQMTSGLDPAVNARAATARIAEAAALGAQFVLTPEMTGVVDGKQDRILTRVRNEADDQVLAQLRAEAKKSGVWLLIGSLAVTVAGSDKLANRSFLVDPDGAIRARYDKIHLFDVDLPSGERYRESSTYQPGSQAVVAETPWAKIGLSICYDLRFAHLYRALAQAGAAILTVPAAFTKVTGEAHWHTLLRARAIETGCYVLAPAQTGLHEDGRRTFGHSLAVAPWGEVLADGGDRPGVNVVDIDLQRVAEARRRIPAMMHDRDFEVSAA